MRPPIARTLESAALFAINQASSATISRLSEHIKERKTILGRVAELEKRLKKLEESQK